jgi:hypothetical protein
MTSPVAGLMLSRLVPAVLHSPPIQCFASLRFATISLSWLSDCEHFQTPLYILTMFMAH